MMLLLFRLGVGVVFPWPGPASFSIYKIRFILGRSGTIDWIFHLETLISCFLAALSMY